MIEDGKRDVATQISAAKLEAAKETAMRMKAKGYPNEDIAEITVLSVVDIEALV
jgi:hypothetical protein